MKNYVFGIIGGIIGGIVASIPWVLLSVYGNYILSILAALIAMGVVFGYRKLKGPMNRSTPIIVIVLSLVIVVVTTLVIIPLASLGKEGYEVSFYNLQILYESKEYMNALMIDLVISIVFTFLGIGGVISKLKQELQLEDKTVIGS